MALDPTDLADDIKGDIMITAGITDLPGFDNFVDRLSIHITNQIKRGQIAGLTVNTSSGVQTSPVNVT